MGSGSTRERSDAARNRRAILDAASELLSEFGAENVSIEQIAAAAGVGKGTVFRQTHVSSRSGRKETSPRWASRR